MAAVCGGMVCLLVTTGTMRARAPFRSGLVPLAVLFLLTFLATRAAKRKAPRFTSQREARRGRRASQVLANLGASALIAGWFSWASADGLIALVVILAALGEATADTLSSELGQAFGGTPYLLTTMRTAAAGTDGAVSLLGTTAGILGAVLVTGAGAWAMRLSLRVSLFALAGAVAGLLFDSLLGATVERRGWLNNDLVNFSSTVFAAGITLLLLLAGSSL